MNLSVGIVGLPNVGKSTLFNALLKKQIAFVANYPFATIEPNVGIVPVPDERLDQLAEVISNEVIEKLRKESPNYKLPVTNYPPIVPATVKFVDIAGLVKGASEGAGLGNKFLSHIREVSVVAHVVRDFKDENVIREGSVDAKTDYETIRTELILADLQSLGKVNEKSLRTDPIKKGAVEKLRSLLDQGKSAFDVNLSDEEKASVKEFGLLSGKAEIIVINVAEGECTEANIPTIVKAHSQALGIVPERFVVICAKIEAELAELSEEEQKQYLSDLGLKQSGLERLIRKAYETLGLISFLTAGEKEVRAWTIRRGVTSLMASGIIHTDFMQKFIKAEVVSYNDFISLGGLRGAREKGKARMEGRDYIMRDGDVVEFKIGQ